MVVAGEIPDGVTVERVVYTQHAPDETGETTGETERYLFEIRPRVRDALDHVPFDPVEVRRRDDGDDTHAAGPDLESDSAPETDSDPNRDDDPEYDVDFDGDFEFRIE